MSLTYIRCLFLVCLAGSFIFLPMPSQGQQPYPSWDIEVKINGVEGELLENIEGFLSLMNEKETRGGNPAWLKRLYARAPGEISAAMEPFGYYNPSINSSMERKGNRWLFVFDIDPGKRATINNIDLKITGPGSKEPLLKKEIAKNPFHKGNPFDQDKYEEFKNRVLRDAFSLGYAEARTEKSLVMVNKAKNDVSINLYFNTGPLYHLGKVLCDQDIITNDLMERYTSILIPGELYSQKRLQELQGNLVNSGYFSRVEVNPMFDEAKDEKVPVKIRTLPAKRHRFSVGGGYDTRIGLNGSLGWKNRRWNRQGHSSDLMMRLSMPNSSLKGTYWIPVLNPVTDRVGIGSMLEREVTDDTERITANLDGGWYFDRNGWTSSLFSELKLERFQTGDEDWTGTVLLSIGGKTAFSRFDSGRFPLSGWSIETDLRGAPGVISDTAYCRWDTKLNALYPLLKRGRLNMGLRTGMAWVDKFDQYPASLRFFAGGDNSIRGYKWKELGPKDSKGDVEGGKNIMTGSVEYDYRVLEDWVGALFLDAGNAFNDSIDKIYVGAGAGIRWLSPVGAVKFDCAWPMNEDGRGPKLTSIHFYFGFEINI